MEYTSYHSSHFKLLAFQGNLKQKTDKQNKAWWQFDPSTAPVEENGPVASLSSSQCLALPPLRSKHQINLYLLTGGLSHIISSLRAGIRGFQTQRPVKEPRQEREQNVGKMAVGIKHRVCLFSHTSRPGESCGNKVQGPGRLDSVPTLSLLPWGPQLSLLVSLGLSFLIHKMGSKRNKLLLGGLHGAENVLSAWYLSSNLILQQE